MPVTQLRNRLDEQFVVAFEKDTSGEEIVWDWAYAPTEQGMTVVLSIWIKGMILGQELNLLTPILPQQLKDQEQTDKVVRELIEQALKQRAQSIEFPTTTDAIAQMAAQQEGLTNPNGVS